MVKKMTIKDKVLKLIGEVEYYRKNGSMCLEIPNPWRRLMFAIHAPCVIETLSPPEYGLGFRMVPVHSMCHIRVWRHQFVIEWR